MTKFCAILLLGSCSLFTRAQFFQKSDTLNQKRLIGLSLGLGVIQSSSTLALSSVWYTQFEQEKFHFFNDGPEWLQMDKTGHAYSAYALSSLCEPAFRWTGLSLKQSYWAAAISSNTYLTLVELLDARSSAWGFSWWDIGANTLGNAYYLFSKSDLGNAFDFKFSFSRSPYAALRPSHLGEGYAQELLKDYNGQTYWINFTPLQRTSMSWPLKAIQLSFGYSAKGMLHAREPVYTAQGQTYRAAREGILSLDFNIEEIPFRRKWVKQLLTPLNFIKIPFPALILSQGNITGTWLYF